MELMNVKESSVDHKEQIDCITNAIRKSEQYIEDFTVHSGWLGLSLFYCMLARYKANDIYFDNAEVCLDKAVALSSPRFYKKKYKTDSYDYQLAQMGIYFLFCERNRFIDLDTTLFLRSIDSTLLDLGKSKIHAGDFSQFSGAFATARYFLEKGDLTEDVMCFYKALIDSVIESAKQDIDGGYYWHSPLLDNGVYVGISHGSAMIIAFFSVFVERGIYEKKCLDVIRRAARFITKQKRSTLKGLFPVVIGEPEKATQFSQCYGDLGVGYGLLRAAQVLKSNELLYEANMVLKSCLLRRYEDKLTGDAGLTYGATGLAQLFYKIADIRNGDHRFVNAGNYWMQQTTRFVKSENGFAGYVPIAKDLPYDTYLSYGWGIIGIGIALMTHLRPDLPKTDCFNIYI